MACLEGWSFINFRLSCVGNLIYNDLKLVMNDKRVWDSFLFWSTLEKDPDLAVKCVTGGCFPYVDLTNDDGTVAGCWSILRPDHISLNNTDVKSAGLEENLVKRKAKLKDLESTILHELVHWGRHQTSSPHLKYAKMKSKWVETGFGNADCGHRFQEEAYPDRPLILPVR